MGTGIVVCGLNGSGKSTLGRALAEELDYHFIDNEDLYFPKTDPRYLYAAPRTRKEVEELLLEEINAHEDFIFASVRGDYGETVCSFFNYIVLIDVPKEIRMQRVKNRSFEKFGDRMRPGGDLCEQEECFFHLVESRAENTVEEWLKTQSCPVIRVDGTKAVKENINRILSKLNREEKTDDRSNDK